MSMISQLTARVADPGVDAMALNWSLLTWKLKIDLWLSAESLTVNWLTWVVLARGCDSCTHEPEVSESELADMGCVLARGCDSCTHESGFSESEVADMGCVLARSCDSCTHEPWFCGLKFGDEVGLGDSSNLETRFVNDPSRDLCASVPMKIVLVRAHDWFDDHSEVSVEQQVEPYLKFLRPLLSQVADNTDASWWLLDSGASTSVLAESNLSAFRSVLQDSEGLGGYRAANGSSVNMALPRLEYRCTCQAHQVMIGVGRRHV